MTTLHAPPAGGKPTRTEPVALITGRDLLLARSALRRLGRWAVIRADVDTALAAAEALVALDGLDEPSPHTLMAHRAGGRG